MMYDNSYPILFSKQMEMASFPMLAKSLFETGDLHED